MSSLYILMDCVFPLKKPHKFICEKCDFKCLQKRDWDRHINTSKHEKNYKIVTKSDEKSLNTFLCDCSKSYKYRQGLWKHKKICKFLEKSNEPPEPEKTEEPINYGLPQTNLEIQYLLLETLKQNQELQKQIIEMSKDRNTHIQNTTNNNSFNLNIFLNEKCKDALNIQDFIDTIKLQVSDLEETGRLGYVEGLKNIFVRGLKELDVYKRPIHCSDLKREIVYVKENNEWSKENPDKDRVKKAIRQISVRNAKQINEWVKTHEGYEDYYNKNNDKYMKLIMEANGGEPEEVNKVLKHVVKLVTIDKSEKYQ